MLPVYRPSPLASPTVFRPASLRLLACAAALLAGALSGCVPNGRYAGYPPQGAPGYAYGYGQPYPGPAYPGQAYPAQPYPSQYGPGSASRDPMDSGVPGDLPLNAGPPPPGGVAVGTDPNPAPVQSQPLAPLPPAPAARGAVPPGKIPIAVLLPLSGANARLGRAFLDAAQLALFDLGDKNLALLPRDTGSNVEGAGRAAASAVADGARLIIGPIVADEVAAVKPIAQGARINVIAFSTATQYAGDGTWLLGFLPRQEVLRVGGYAAQRGIHRFGVLAPATPYGQLASDALRDAASQANGAVNVQSYEPGSTDVSAQVRSLAQSGPPGALLLPEGGARLKAIAAQLRPNGVDPSEVKILGSGVWDEPGLGQEPALRGAWYAAPTPNARAIFERHFQSTYNQKPPRLASLAYDATGLAAVLARTPGADFSAAALTNPSGFAGADGIFRLMPDGTNERGLAVLEVGAEGTKIASPAPETFNEIGQ